MNEGLMFALVAAALALVYGAMSIKWINGLPTGNDRMREIAAAVQEGAQAYLNRQYTPIGIARPFSPRPSQITCRGPAGICSPETSASSRKPSPRNADAPAGPARPTSRSLPVLGASPESASPPSS